MLGKLMKYELRWTGRYLLPLYIILAFITVIGRIIMNNANFETDITGVIFVFLFIGYMFSIMSVTFGTFIIVMVRFYKNMLTDEGYLTFTLPAKVSTHILAKTIVASIWTFLSTLIGFVSVYLLISGNSEVSASVNVAINEMRVEMFQVYGSSIVIVMIEWVLAVIVASVLNVLYVYVSIAIGQVISKNKILGSVAAYIIISMVIQFIMTIGMIIIGVFNFDKLDNGDALSLLNTLMTFIIVFSIGLSVAFYYITTHILSKKLNLE